ncbi:hypothetical protein [Paenibacillus apiarius]
MTQWALEHPYLTAFLVLVLLFVIDVGITNWAKAFAIRNGKGDAE